MKIYQRNQTIQKMPIKFASPLRYGKLPAEASRDREFSVGGSPQVNPGGLSFATAWFDMASSLDADDRKGKDGDFSARLFPVC
jgi:type IV secretory pathway ATPase VirB11/archaellum biosynthesis ATPase